LENLRGKDHSIKHA